MKNGYCLPCKKDSMKVLTTAIEKNESELSKQIINNLRIGIHWSTEVTNKNQKNKPHRVTQGLLFFF